MSVFQEYTDDALFVIFDEFNVFYKTFAFKDFSNSFFDVYAGTSSTSCFAWLALRIRVRKSAIGSVITIIISPLTSSLQVALAS